MPGKATRRGRRLEPDRGRCRPLAERRQTPQTESTQGPRDGRLIEASHLWGPRRREPFEGARNTESPASEEADRRRLTDEGRTRSERSDGPDAESSERWARRLVPPSLTVLAALQEEEEEVRRSKSHSAEDET